jgi:hypothetical protein
MEELKVLEAHCSITSRFEWRRVLVMSMHIRYFSCQDLLGGGDVKAKGGDILAGNKAGVVWEVVHHEGKAF